MRRFCSSFAQESFDGIWVEGISLLYFNSRYATDEDAADADDAEDASNQTAEAGKSQKGPLQGA